MRLSHSPIPRKPSWVSRQDREKETERTIERAVATSMLRSLTRITCCSQQTWDRISRVRDLLNGFSNAIYKRCRSRSRWPSTRQFCRDKELLERSMWKFIRKEDLKSAEVFQREISGRLTVILDLEHDSIRLIYLICKCVM